MGNWHRVGVGVLDRPGPALALFVPSGLPTLTVAPAGCGRHVSLAAGWALNVLGHAFHGGHLVLVSDPSSAAWTECLVTVLAVDDAAAGGHRPTGTLGSGLLDRVLRDPRGVADLAAAVRL